MSTFLKILMTLSISLFGTLALSAIDAPSGDHSHHNVKHNFIMYGENPIYASHLIYKAPHNFQVILQLNLSSQLVTSISELRIQNPNAVFYFEALNLDFSEFSNVNELTGAIFYEDEAGRRHTVIESNSITKDNFKVIYFYQLPLDLSKK